MEKVQRDNPARKRGFLLGKTNMPLIMTWADLEGFEKFSKVIKNMDKNVQKAAVRALNRTGDSARGQVRKALAKQTGLKQKVFQKALKTNKAKPGRLSYEIFSKGGDIALKFFAARETRGGVSANPFGQRKVFASTFMKGGLFPNRYGDVFHGHVVKRLGGRKFPIKVVKSGVIIPNEMVKGASQAAFEKAVKEVLPKRMEHELQRLGL